MTYLGAPFRSVNGPNKRKLAFEVTGDPNGMPVFLMHATPGSRKGPKPRGIVIHRLGIQLISYDRPGYGRSTRHRGRSVASAAADVAAIADELGIEQFAVVGWSEGGPHALACAALLSDRVTRAATLASFAPPDAVDLKWFGNMAEHNVTEYNNADRVPGAFIEELDKRVIEIKQDPDALIRTIEPALARRDLQVLENHALRTLITDGYLEAVRQGVAGWVDDTFALRRPWGFPLDAITAEVRLWHGDEDTFVPRSHTEWLGRRIRYSTVDVRPEAGHFAALELLPAMLTWLADGDSF